MRSYGLSCSSHARTSAPIVISSRARSSSNFGQTYATSPRAGMIATNVRSLAHQLTPVK